MWLPRFSWRAGLHRRRSVNAPLILVLPLSTSTSHSFASFYLSQYLHSSFSRVCLFFIFHLKASLLSHSFHILSSAECAELPAEKARVHIISPPQSNLTFLHREFSRSWWAGPCCNSHLVPPWLRTLRLPTFTCLLSTDQCHQCQWL